MRSSSDEDESEATKIFAFKSNREFRSEFLGKKTTMKDIENERRVHDLKLRVSEAEANIQQYKSIAHSAKVEAAELKANNNELLEKYSKAKDEINYLKTNVERLSEIERDSISKKCHIDFLLQNYRTALTKYKTWYEYEHKQLKVLKDMLVDVGKWTPENRYKVYFLYKSEMPTLINDDDVAEYAQGSVYDYKGIDDIENLDEPILSSRVYNVSTQTDVMEDNIQSITDNNVENQSFKMSNSELEFLDLRNKVRKFEQDALELKEKMAVLTKKGDPTSLMEENKILHQQIEELKMKLNEFEEQEKIFTQKLIESENVVNKLNEEQEKNESLMKKTLELEEQIQLLKSSNESTKEGNNDISQMNQTTEPSVVFYHLRDNPMTNAVKEFEAREAKRLRLDPDATQIDYQKYSEAVEMVNKLQNEVHELNEKKEQLRNNWSSASKIYLNIVKKITGYDIKIRDEPYIEVSNVYDISNHLIFERYGEETRLLENKYALSLKSLMDIYLPASLPAFTAALTLDLYQKQGLTT